MWPFASCAPAEEPEKAKTPAEEPEKAKTLEEGLAAAAVYEGDPMDCPCIAHMKEGPCGDKFVVAYKCFLDSKEEEKGSDCLEPFRSMQQCFSENPDHYEEFLGDDEANSEEEDKRTETQDWHLNNF